MDDKAHVVVKIGLDLQQFSGGRGAVVVVLRILTQKLGDNRRRTKRKWDVCVIYPEASMENFKNDYKPSTLPPPSIGK
jgi:hypothetical protein